MTHGLVTFQVGEARPRCGLLIDGRVYDIAGLTGNPDHATTRGVLEAGGDLIASLFETVSINVKAGIELAECRLLPPVPNPGAVYCAGANYRDHVVNMARRLNIEPEPDPHLAGLSPWHFIKSSWCVVGPDSSVELDSNFLDWEAELAVVIGKAARHVSQADAFDYVAGYTIANDLSARDRTQRQAVHIASPFRYDWIGQKNFEGACPMGPVLVLRDVISDPQNLTIKTYVNSALKQNSSTSKMIFNIAEQISHLSKCLTLHPGDVVLTGTPAGTGAETGECLAKGDIVKIEIEKLGSLTTIIV